ncbi:MAG: hypothetical protein SVY53_00820 [Chloroflexota bacterium]|nr:hypothetical protein [Chloroflexota bacterium]
MNRVVGIIATVLGVATLVLGIFFILMAGNIRNEVVDTIAEEGFPVLTYSEEMGYPYLSVDDEFINTSEKIEAAADELKKARHAIVDAPVGSAGFLELFGPSTIPMLESNPQIPEELRPEVDTLQLHEYSAILSFEMALGAAESGLALASLVQYIGFALAVIGIGLMAAGTVGILSKD